MPPHTLGLRPTVTLPCTMMTRLNDDRCAIFSARLLLLGRSRVRLCVSQRGCGAPTMGHSWHAWGDVPVPPRCVWGTGSRPLQCAWGADYGSCGMCGAPALGPYKVCGAPIVGLCSVSGGPTVAPTDLWQHSEPGGWIRGAGFGSLGVKGPFAC